MRPYAWLAVLLAGACTNPQVAEPSLKPLVGASERSLVAAMGRAPDVSFEPVPGTKLLQWREQKTYAMADRQLGYSYAGGAIRPIPHTQTGMMRDECLTEWTVEQGIAKSYRQEGTACPA